jgi:hypothetical protein
MKADQPCSRHDALTYAAFSAFALRLLVLAFICLGVIAPAQAAKKATEKPPATTAAPEARLSGDDIAMGIIARAKVSDKDNTAVLMPLTGTWDFVESFWTDPKAEPEHANGFVTNDMVMGGRYLSSKAVGSIGIGREQIPFEGQELIGFDNAKKSLFFVAVDTLTTGMTIGSGKFEEKESAPTKTAGIKTGDSKTDGKERIIRETGRFTHPLTGVEQGFRSELTFVDADHYKRTVFTVHGSGRESKLSEIDYTRRM